MTGTDLDVERDLIECSGTGKPVDSLDPAYFPKFDVVGPVMVTCDDCGQEVEADSGGSSEDGYSLVLPWHEREATLDDLNREGDPHFNGAFTSW